MRYPAYSDHKPTTIEWAISIPAHWGVSSAKMNFLMQLGKMLQNDAAGAADIEMTYLKAVHVNWNKVTTAELPKMWASPLEVEKYAIENGDLLVCEGGEVGRAAILNNLTEPAIIQNALHRLRNTPRGQVGYFAYLLKHIADVGWFGILCNKATIAHLTGEKLGAIQMPVPPTAEQRKITDFLDWKTGQIDALIAKKRALIGKLKEKRLAVITQAVTKGLDSAAPLRDSGISWLGKVPFSWSVKRLRYCAGMVTSGSRGWAEFFSESGPLFLRITNLDRESICLKLDDIQRVEPPDGAEGARTLTKAGDLLISITADLGSVAVIPPGFESAYISQHLSLVRLDSDDIDPNWIAYSILSLAGKYQLNTAGYGGTKIQLSLSDIKDIRFCHPTSLDEQRRVLRAVQNEIERNNKLIELAEDAITRLTEYRTALITAATTGQIDVRQIEIPAQA